ncbi:unnamed protein product, partial [Onchocerca flexuosa]|uniref:Beta-N-acetylhexosaminidase n=1 Tax=Onchocerca flexuosa TaxID=387005 RepID=A0A183HFH6_9BILA
MQILEQLAFINNLEVIPLVQTFGHMEFVLKHAEYSVYREDIMNHDTICPSNEGSWHLITKMLTQVRIMHPNAKRIHIGADEAYTIAKYAKKTLGFTEVLAWNDMFGDIDVNLLNEYKMGELVVPVIWGYAVNVTKPDYFPKDMFERYSQAFPKMIFASAFKGANGQNEFFCYIRRYLANQQS